MLLRYILFFVLVWAFWRFLDRVIGLGKKSLRANPSVDGKTSPARQRRPGRDIADAEFEILPEDPPKESEPEE